MKNDFLTVREAAAAFSTLLRSERALRRLVEEGRVHVFRVGGSLRFQRARLERELAALVVEPRAAVAGRVAVAGAAEAPAAGRDGFIHPRLAGLLK